MAEIARFRQSSSIDWDDLSTRVGGFLAAFSTPRALLPDNTKPWQTVLYVAAREGSSLEEGSGLERPGKAGLVQWEGSAPRKAWPATD